jgi:hypothetical protein
MRTLLSLPSALVLLLTLSPEAGADDDLEVGGFYLDVSSEKGKSIVPIL